MKKVTQLCPLSVKVDAVYYDAKENLMTRVPVQALAVYDDTECAGGGYVGFVLIDEDGFVSIGLEIEDNGNFVGFDIEKQKTSVGGIEQSILDRIQERQKKEAFIMDKTSKEEP